MIPKIIHYCWFGGNEKPKSVLKMLESWRKFCPDYVIKEWNESNFDINYNQYTKEAYQCGKWAFVSDVARLYALHTDGGIYLDTDVEVLKSFDYLLHNNLFFGFEGTEWIGTNIIGAEKENDVIGVFLDKYNCLNFINKNNTQNTTTNVERLTALLREKYNIVINGNEQVTDKLHLYPTDYFCPYDYINGKLNITNNSYSIHWYSQSWIERNIFKRKLMQLFHRIVGVKMR